MTEPQWEWVYPPVPLIAARCRRCYRLHAKYLYQLDGDSKDSGSGQWEFGSRNACDCDPPPVLPDGAELERLIERAKPKANRSTVVNAVVTIRV